MNAPSTPDPDLEKRLAARLLDVLIRAGFVFAMAVLCYQIFSPFLALMVWALILAVTLYPAHQKLAHKMGEKQGLAATTLVLGGIVLIGVPTAVLMFELGDSVHRFIGSLRDHTLQIPAPGRALPSGRSSARRSMVFGRRPIRICRHSFGAWSRRLATWPKPRWDLLPASVARCCCFWSPSSLPESSWPSVSRAPEAPVPFSIASSAQNGAKNLPGCPRRRFVQWH